MKSSSLILLLCAEILLPAALHAAQVEGTVRDRSGKPQAHAEVSLWYWDWLKPEYPFRVRARADDAGRYRFQGLPPSAGEGRILAYLSGRPMASPVGGPGMGARLDVAAAGNPLDLVLEPSTVLKVVFKVPQGLPPAEGVVSLDREEHWSPFSGSEAVLVGLAPGTLSVKYFTELYGGGAFLVEMGQAQSKDTVIQLVKPEWVEGRILDPAGNPVAGALYRTDNSFKGGLALSGPDGRFRVKRPKAGGFQLLIRDYRFRDTALAVERRDMASALEVRLDAGAGVLGGRIANLRSDGLRACSVSARPALQDARSAAGGRSRAKFPGGPGKRALPAEDGAFALTGLEEETYLLRVACEGTNAWEDTLRPGGEPPALVLGRVRALSGSVAGEGGLPLESYALGVFGGPPESVEEALAGQAEEIHALGRFRVPSRFQGANLVCARAAGYVPACREFGPEDTSGAALALDKCLTLALRVRSAGSGRQGLPGARIKLRKLGQKGAGWTGTTDAQGRFAQDGLGPGDYLVEARETGHIAFRKTLALPGEGEREVILEEGGTLAGSVLQGDGRPARGLRILAKQEWTSGGKYPWSMSEPVSLESGNFRITGLPPVPLTLGIAAPWSKSSPFLPLFRADNLVPGGAPVEIILPPSRVWEIRPCAGGRPLQGEAEIHFLLPSQQDTLPGEPLGSALAKVPFRQVYAVPVFTGIKYIVVLSARGYRGRTDTVVVPSGVEPFESRPELAALPELRGSVTVTQGGGFPGLRVSVPGGPWAPVAPDGEFRIAGLPPGPVFLNLADARGRLVWTGPGLAGEDETRIPATDTGTWTEGLAVDAGNRPVAGARVTVRRRENRDSLLSVLADGEGRFRFQSPAGVYLACPGNSPAPCTRVAAGSPSALPLKVRFAGSERAVALNFRLPMALPARGGTFLQMPEGPLRPLEMRDGEYLFAANTFRAVPAGRHAFFAYAYWSPGASSPPSLFWASDSLDGAADRRDWEAAGAVAIVSRDGEGRPLGGVHIRFLPRTPGSGRAWGDGGGAEGPWADFPGTDRRGTLECLGVLPGKYWVYAFHASHACPPVACEIRKAARAAAPLSLSLVLRPGGSLRVKVAHGGYPAVGARVEVFDTLGNPAAPAGAGAWDWQGNYECGAFPPGRYRVVASAPNLARQARSAELGGGEVNLEAALPAAGWLEVVGEGLEDKSFYLKDGNNQVTPLQRQAERPPVGSDAAGPASLIFAGIAPEKYQVWMEGGKQGLGEIEIKPGRLSVLEVGRLERLRVALPQRRG